MRKIAAMCALAGASLAALTSRQAMFDSRIFGFENIRRALRSQKPDYAWRGSNSIATGNRHGGPHLHQRESARRLRQIGATL